MKIEKLTENKIRIILKQEDLEKNELDIQTLLSSTPTSQEFLLDILKTAKKEIGFETDGYKLFIEAFSNSNDVIAFTITKFQLQKNFSNSKKQINLPEKTSNDESDFFVYNFKTFDDFCNFCSLLNAKNRHITRKLINNSSLFFYKDNIYLTLSGINKNNTYTNKFFTLISEFANLSTCNKIFENILHEHGKYIIKKNPISTTIKYFI